MNWPIVVQVVIDGKHFESIKAAHGAAQARGFLGGISALHGRLRNGASTWAEVLAPLRVGGNTVKRSATLAAAAVEMAAMCAALDLRKAELRCVA